jgi:hypothetical protein
MPNSRLEEQQRSDLRPHLEEILSCVKSLHVTLCAVMADIAATRKTVFDNLDNIEIYRTHLKQAIETAMPLVDEAMLSYDSLMQAISDSQQWTN